MAIYLRHFNVKIHTFLTIFDSICVARILYVFTIDNWITTDAYLLLTTSSLIIATKADLHRKHQFTFCKCLQNIPHLWIVRSLHIMRLKCFIYGHRVAVSKVPMGEWWSSFDIILNTIAIEIVNERLQINTNGKR